MSLRDNHDSPQTPFSKNRRLASVHKDLRLCEELAFITQRAGGQSRSSYNSFVFCALCREFLESPQKSRALRFDELIAG